MNNVLELKGQFQNRAREAKGASASLRHGTKVSAEHLRNLSKDIEKVSKYWKNNHKYIPDVLISVHYISVVAKSNRVNHGLLCKGNTKGNDTVKGAKFTDDDKEPKHIITHYVKQEILDETKDRLDACAEIVEKKFHGVVDADTIQKINEGKIVVPEMAKSKFSNVIKDAYYVESFSVEMDPEITGDTAIVTLLDTGVDADTILDQAGIKSSHIDKYDENTVLLKKNDYEILCKAVPYLVIMAVDDISKYDALEEYSNNNYENETLFSR